MLPISRLLTFPVPRPPSDTSDTSDTSDLPSQFVEDIKIASTIYPGTVPYLAGIAKRIAADARREGQSTPAKRPRPSRE